MHVRLSFARFTTSPRLAVQGMMDPAAMQQMMQSPLMQQLLNNPEVMRNMLQMNPAVREVRRRSSWKQAQLGRVVHN
jgi:hypothetical protein